jgi:hypothetical protein
MAYDSWVSLVACPFCHELFERGERFDCPHCDVRLADFEKVVPPQSHLRDDDIPVAPEYEPLPPLDLRRGKGAVLALALAGIGLFFLPWVWMTLPETVTFTGYELARRLGWSWGAVCAWGVLIPTVLSRQCVAQLRGARVAATFLSAVPLVTVAILMARPPHSALVPVRFTWGWPVYATAAVSLAASMASLRLGGRIDDLRVARGTSRGNTLH